MSAIRHQPGPAARSHRRFQPQDDTGSIAILMMVILVATTLSALLVPMIVGQARSTRFTASRVQELDAAQAGIDVALGAIRAAVTPNGAGDSTKLPCGPITGNVDLTGPGHYKAIIEYFTFDPVSELPVDPVTEVPLSTSKMRCVTGYGTFTSTSTRVTPSYARISATGDIGTTPRVDGSDAGRTLVSTYVVRTSDVNIPGGVIKLQPGQLCMDAGSSPAAAANLVVQVCSTATPAIAQQIFVYRYDLTIQSPSSVTTTYPNGLCITRPASSGSFVTLTACTALGGTPSYTQQWSFNDHGAFEASVSTSQADGGLAGLCMNVAAQTLPQTITLATCLNGPNTDPRQGWVSSPSVGAGGAASPQWVNYYEFGRCLDVTAHDPRTDHLIDYPCKQNPYAPAIQWNEKFDALPIPAGQTSVVSQLSTITSGEKVGSATAAYNGQKFCLTSPGIDGAYVTVGGTGTTANACTTPTALQTWTIYGGDPSLPYSTRYTIRDNSTPKLCLGLGAPYTAETTSAVVVETCTGATDQKWNAKPSLSTPALQNTIER